MGGGSCKGEPPSTPKVEQVDWEMLLFVCYPLGPVLAFLVAQAVLNQQSGLALGLCLLSYSALLAALLGCGRMGGKAAHCYRAGAGAALLHGLAAAWLVTHPADGWGVGHNGWLLTAYAVFCACSLAGADLGRRTGQVGEAGKQMLSPVLLLVSLLVMVCAGYLAILVSPLPLVIYGLQGFGAMALATHLRQGAQPPSRRSSIRP